MSRPYTITIDTDNPHILDEIAKCPGNWEATMTEHHPVTNEVVDTWRRSNTERGGSLSDPTDVGMVVVDPGMKEAREEHLRSKAEGGDPWDEG